MSGNLEMIKGSVTSVWRHLWWWQWWRDFWPPGLGGGEGGECTELKYNGLKWYEATRCALPCSNATHWITLHCAICAYICTYICVMHWNSIMCIEASRVHWNMLHFQNAIIPHIWHSHHSQCLWRQILSCWEMENLNICNYFVWLWQILNLRRAGLSTGFWREKNQGIELCHIAMDSRHM